MLGGAVAYGRPGIVQESLALRSWHEVRSPGLAVDRQAPAADRRRAADALPAALDALGVVQAGGRDLHHPRPDPEPAHAVQLRRRLERARPAVHRLLPEL